MSMNPHTVPKDGFIGTGTKASVYNSVTSSNHDIATTADQEYVLGQKIRYYNSTLGGWGTCIYLQLIAGAVTVVAGSPVGVDDTADSYYAVTGDRSETGAGCARAIALSTMTTTNYGWFWCAGVCPDFSTDGTTAFSEVTVPVGTDITAGANFEFTADLNITLGTNDATLTKMGYSLIATGGTSSDLANLVLFDTWQ